MLMIVLLVLLVLLVAGGGVYIGANVVHVLLVVLAVCAVVWLARGLGPWRLR